MRALVRRTCCSTEVFFGFHKNLNLKSGIDKHTGTSALCRSYSFENPLPVFGRRMCWQVCCSGELASNFSAQVRNCVDQALTLLPLHTKSHRSAACKTALRQKPTSWSRGKWIEKREFPSILLTHPQVNKLATTSKKLEKEDTKPATAAAFLY